MDIFQTTGPREAVRFRPMDFVRGGSSTVVKVDRDVPAQDEPGADALRSQIDSFGAPKHFAYQPGG